MRSAKLEDMVKGWFVGHFNPTVHHTDTCEVAVKYYKAGDSEARHYHRIATEITVVVSGRIRMLGREWSAGDIIKLEPGEETEFLALTDTSNVVVKFPSVADDKHIVNL